MSHLLSAQTFVGRLVPHLLNVYSNTCFRGEKSQLHSHNTALFFGPATLKFGPVNLKFGPANVKFAFATLEFRPVTL